MKLKPGPKPLSKTEKTVPAGLKYVESLDNRLKQIVVELKSKGLAANKSKLIRAFIVHGLSNDPHEIYKSTERD